MQLDRHQIVHLDPAAWPALLDAPPGPKAISAVAGWVLLGRPLIARRRSCSDTAGHVPLGLPLPPMMGKQRLAFAVPPEAVLSTGLPPLVADAITVAPLAWRPTLAALVAIDRNVRCFGSLAWEYLTGLPYLSATSDVDLLWQAATVEDADRLAGAIARIAAAAPMGLDGEIVAPGGFAVQWREWAGDARELLAKSSGGSRVMLRGAVFA